MAREDGVESAVQAFYKHLPMEALVCDVSVFCGESRLAQVFCAQCGFKMCYEVSDAIHGHIDVLAIDSPRDSHAQLSSQAQRQAPQASATYESPPTTPTRSQAPKNRLNHDLYLCSYINWDERRPHSATDGLIQGLSAFVGEVAGGFTNAVKRPAVGLVGEGLQGVPIYSRIYCCCNVLVVFHSGGAAGMVAGVRGLLVSPYVGSQAMIKKVREGLLTKDCIRAPITKHMHGYIHSGDADTLSDLESEGSDFALEGGDAERKKDAAVGDIGEYERDGLFYGIDATKTIGQPDGSGNGDQNLVAASAYARYFEHDKFGSDVLMEDLEEIESDIDTISTIEQDHGQSGAPSEGIPGDDGDGAVGGEDKLVSCDTEIGAAAFCGVDVDDIDDDELGDLPFVITTSQTATQDIYTNDRAGGTADINRLRITDQTVEPHSEDNEQAFSACFRLDASGESRQADHGPEETGRHDESVPSNAFLDHLESSRIGLNTGSVFAPLVRAEVQPSETVKRQGSVLSKEAKEVPAPAKEPSQTTTPAEGIAGGRRRPSRDEPDKQSDLRKQRRTQEILTAFEEAQKVQALMCDLSGSKNRSLFKHVYSIQ
jgi:hypothetical protein